MKSNKLHRFVVLLLFSCILISFGAVRLYAQGSPAAHKLTVRAEKATAIYQKGETVSFHVRLLADGKPLAGQSLTYLVQGDGRYEKKGTVTSMDAVAVIEASLDRPGFLKCAVSWDEAPGGKISALGGAGVDPQEIRAVTPEPEDFDTFWNAKKKELDEMPLNPKLEPVAAEQVKNPAMQVYDIKVDCLGGDHLLGAPVSGYFAKPVEARPKSLPIVISYHGAGVRSATMPIADAAKNTLALDINAHGIENGQPAEFYESLNRGDLKGYHLFDASDREKLYFVGMFLRVYRSLQFMKSQPEWDGKTIVVRGMSQGGGQALVAAGLDPQVTFCAAFVPALCYPTGDIEGNFGGWPGFLRGKKSGGADGSTENSEGNEADPAIVRAVQYIDAANFAKRIKAETILSTGFIDYTCSPTSVYVAYNGITAPKQIFPTPETAHSVPPATMSTVNKLLWDFVERNRVKADNVAE